MDSGQYAKAIQRSFDKYPHLSPNLPFHKDTLKLADEFHVESAMTKIWIKDEVILLGFFLFIYNLSQQGVLPFQIEDKQTYQE